MPELDRARHAGERPCLGRSLTSECVSSKLEDAMRRGARLLEVGVDPAQTLDRRVEHEGRKDEAEEVARRHGRRRDLVLAVPQQADDRRAAEKLHDRRHQRERAGDLQSRAVEPVRRGCKARRFVRLRRERLHDPMSGERLGGEMGELFEVLLTAAARAADALAEADQRIDDQRRARHRDERQPPIEVEHHHRIADDRQPFAQQVADRFGHRLLDLIDVVGDARHQLTSGPSPEEGCGLIQNVAEQLIAQVADHPLTDVGHQVGREVRAQALRRDRRPE